MKKLLSVFACHSERSEESQSRRILRCFALLNMTLCVICVNLCFADVKVSKFFGTVSVYQNQNWLDAEQDMVLSQQDKIKTGPAGRVELVMDDTNRLWVHENSEVEVSSLGSENIFSLLIGKIRAKIKLVGQKKFTINTPTTICAVRGTDFIISDKGELLVLEGKVEFSNISGSGSVLVEKWQSAEIDSSGKVSQPRNLSAEEINVKLQEWSSFDDIKQEGLNIEQEQKEAKKKNLQDEITNLRQELHEIVANIKRDVEVTREIVNEIKEADFATGRSLKDIHGNLVRVEQHLLRPDSQTLQFLNLTKRDSYTYKGRFKYEGPSGSRLDVLETKITFNQSLPDQITEWPGFIAGQDENTFYPQSLYCKLTNQTDKIEIKGVSKDKGELDGEGKVLTERSIVTDTYMNGWKVDPVYDTGDPSRAEYNLNDKNIEADGEATGDLWATNISPKIKLDKAGESSKYVHLFSEVYGINNDGKLLNLKNFTSTSENPFTVLKEVAVENILSIREGNTVNSTDFLKRGNIDLVVTPDIVVAIARKLATEASSISDSIK